MRQTKRQRNILANRAKRHRYKKNKKVKWSKKLAQLWKDRADAYERGSSGRDDISETDERDGTCSFSQERSNEKDKSMETTAAIEESYVNVQKDCELEGIHLFPQIVFPENSTTKDVTLEKKLLACAREKDKALRDALHYRTLVENLETDITELKTTMHRRVSAVRDFWRNNILEGRTRSGVILKRALTQHKE